MDRRLFGNNAELAVVDFLIENSFTILEQNYAKFFGEIDIIAQKDDLIVFVEVKARNNPQASMLTLITPSKQRKIIKVAREYISKFGQERATYRFDVALVVGEKNITYIPNAFTQKER